MKFPDNLPSARVLFVGADGCVLFAESLGYGSPFRVCFPFEMDWLVRRPVNSFTRETSHQFGELSRILLRVFDLLFKGAFRRSITNFPNTRLEHSDLRIPWIRCSEVVTLVDKCDGLRREIRSERTETAGRDVAFRRF